MSENYLKYSKYIDHTCLKQNASYENIKKLCDEAQKYEFFSVCVNPFYVSYAKKILMKSNVKVCTVVGFPLGQNTTESKTYECVDAVQKGADEIDMVINVSELKNKNLNYCIDEINHVKKACLGKTLKVIVETCLLTYEEKLNACYVVLNSQADFIKTSTGFSYGGATFDDIKLFKEKLGNYKKINAAGGIKTSSDLIEMVNLGADRIGTSKGVDLVLGCYDSKNKNY